MLVIRASKARVQLSQAQLLVKVHLVTITEDYSPLPELLSLTLLAPVASSILNVRVYHTSQSFQDCCILHTPFTNSRLFPFVHPQPFATESKELKVPFVFTNAAELFD